MVTASSDPGTSGNTGRWAGLIVAGSLLAIGLPVLFLFVPKATKNEAEHSPRPMIRKLPPPPDNHFPFPSVQLHHIAFEDQGDGRPILRVIAKERGDVIVLDANTGRLLEVRDPKGKPTWAPVPKETEVNPQFAPNG